MQGVARDYWSIWKQFVLYGVMPEDILPPSLMQSWRRCAALGLDPYATNSSTQMMSLLPDALSIPHTLLTLIRPIMEDLHQFTEGSECVIVFADTNARIVDIVGDQNLWGELENLGLYIDACWNEAQQGSNALALALQESFPIQLDGAMHYRAALHALYTSAAPVHDLLGQVIGVLAVIGRHEHAHPHTLGMITAAAQALSNQIQMQVWLSNANNLLSELKTILQALSEGILLLRNDGVISQMNAPAGAMLGLVPAKVTGRRLRDVLPLPAVLNKALATRQLLSYEELVFDTPVGRLTYLCTLKPITASLLETGLEPIVASMSLMIAEPVPTDGFVMILRSIERVQKLVHRMTGAHARLNFSHVVGESPAIKEALRLARLASSSVSTVLLRGETGTGKEIFAQSIHNQSTRANGPFVAINCAAIPRELINTELFGYEGGAFTGADRQGRPGKFEQAHGGTLFLDEIGDMPLDLQTSLLRAIETRSIVRIGGQRVISVDVRIIAATHRDLREEAHKGNFRSDLFYRLNVLSIEIPPLRDRLNDIPLLVQHFLQRQSRILSHPLHIESEIVELLKQYSWPGNVRELENMLERATYLASKNSLSIEDFPVDLRSLSRSTQTEIEAISEQQLSPIASREKPLKAQSMSAEAEAIMHAYRMSNNNMSVAAQRLGISRTTLWRKMVKYGMLEGKQ